MLDKIITCLYTMNMKKQHPTQKTKQLFVLGDSISIHYGEYLKEYVQPHFTYRRKEAEDRVRINQAPQPNTHHQVNLDIPEGANGGDSSMVLEYLKKRWGSNDFHPEILLLNCGLHDIKTNPATHERQISPERYSHNLLTIVSLCKQHNISLVWVRTTPIIDALHNSNMQDFLRFNKDVIYYNELADQLMSIASVPSIDLYSFTSHFGEMGFCDHAHFTKEVRKLQAAFIAGFVMVEKY